MRNFVKIHKEYLIVTIAAVIKSEGGGYTLTEVLKRVPKGGGGDIDIF